MEVVVLGMLNRCIDDRVKLSKTIKGKNEYAENKK